MKKILLASSVLALSASTAVFAADEKEPLADALISLDSQAYVFEYEGYTSSRYSPLMQAMLQLMTKGEESDSTG